MQDNHVAKFEEKKHFFCLISTAFTREEVYFLRNFLVNKIVKHLGINFLKISIFI